MKEERAAVRLSAAVGELLYDYGVELVLLRNQLLDTTTSQVLNLHDYAATVAYKPFSVFTSAALAEELLKIDLAPSKVDIGRLSWEYTTEGDKFSSKEEFVKAKMESFTKASQGETPFKARDVVLYGFGRIGRLACRELVKQAARGQQLRLRAIVTRSNAPEDLTKRAALLKNDSVHGAFKGTVEVDHENESIIVNGQVVKMIFAKNPEDADYEAHGIHDALVIDNTGAYTDRESLERHLQAKGCTKVLLTAPGKGVPNVVYGINQDTLRLDEENVFSAASCTTNAISPVLKVVNDRLKVLKGHVETIHAYTNDQNLLDNMHKKPRRGRSAAVNMVITSTGAGTAVAKVIPDLKDKLTANAVRVPTPNGSLAVLNLEVEREATREEVNDIVRVASLEGSLVNQISYQTDPELVSTDVVGNDCCSVFDSNATIVAQGGKNVVLYAWYDNEYGYTKQVIRMAKYICQVRRHIYY